MARRRNSRNRDNGAGALVLLLLALVAILILAASVIGSVAIFFVALRNYWRVRDLPYAASMDDFGHTREECKQLLQAALEIQQGEAAIADANARGEGRKKRGDERFIARGMGIELNAIIERAEDEIARARREVWSLQALPEWRAETYIGLRAAAAAGATGVLIFGVAFVVLLVTALPAVVAYAGWLEGYLPSVYASEWSHVFASASLGCAIGWLAYAVGKAGFSSRERKRLERAASPG